MKVRRRGYRHKKPYRNIMLVMCLLLVFITIGYASFSTQISMGAKGNIKGKPLTTTDLTKNVVTSGDGLYEDYTESDRYIYRGANPNNYIKLGNDMYRIIAVESDGTLKVMKNESIGSRSFDTASSCSEVAYVTPKNKTRTTTKGDSTTYEIDSVIYTAPEIINCCNKWSRRADLNVYLNESWYSTLQYSDLIQNHTWYVGGIESSETDLETSVNNEKSNTWDGKIGLISVTDYVKASTNSACTSVSAYYGTSGCYNNSATHNWIYKSEKDMWTITPYSVTGEIYMFYVNNSGSLHFDSTMLTYYDRNVFPAFFLSSDITLTGSGTSDSPYEIN